MSKVRELAVALAATVMLASVPAETASLSASQPGEVLYVGALTSGTSRGIYAYRFDPASGSAVFLGLAAVISNPSFLIASRDGRFLYAVSEGNAAAGKQGNTVSAFRIDSETSQLVLINKVPSEGIGPCDLAVDRRGRVLLVANCGSGSVALLPILPDGSLGDAAAMVQHHGSSLNPARQKGPHAHGLAVSPDDRFVLAADLGTDQILLHPMNPSRRTLTAGDFQAPVVPGGGVRHIAFDPKGRFLYAIDELDSAITVFRYSRGTLRKIQTLSAMPPGAPPGRGGSEVETDRSGRFLYASVRGDRNIVRVFSIDAQSGRLTPVQSISSEGKMPRHFALDPSQSWLAVANQNSHSIAWLRRDRDSGRLQSGPAPSREVDSPACIAFAAPRGKRKRAAGCRRGRAGTVDMRGFAKLSYRIIVLHIERVL